MSASKYMALAGKLKRPENAKDCPVCEGSKTIIWALCQCHPNDPNCMHGEEERDCARCEGSGLICGEDGEPLDEQGNCAACLDYLKSQKEAQSEDHADARREDARMGVGQ